MWTSWSRNHTSEHHSPLSSKPHLVITAILGFCRAYAEGQPTAAPDRDRQAREAPFMDGAAGTDSPRPTGQRVALHAALIDPHPPDATPRILRNAVDIGAVGSERRIEPYRASPFRGRHPIPVGYDAHQVW